MINRRQTLGLAAAAFAAGGPAFAAKDEPLAVNASVAIAERSALPDARFSKTGTHKPHRWFHPDCWRRSRRRSRTP